MAESAVDRALDLIFGIMVGGLTRRAGRPGCGGHLSVRYRRSYGSHVWRYRLISDGVGTGSSMEVEASVLRLSPRQLTYFLRRLRVGLDAACKGRRVEGAFMTRGRMLRAEEELGDIL